MDFTELVPIAVRLLEDYKEFNQKDCSNISEAMATMTDGAAPGRVRLSAFYLQGISSHFNFEEKEGYLRTLGALDETDPERPSVIIPNYVMSRTNCLQASNIFTICCLMEECDELLQKVEAEVGGAVTTVNTVATIITNLRNAERASASLTEGNIPPNLMTRLTEIAEANDGMVPLHGRLFKQWMHHAFPLHCPFPHERGTVLQMSQADWTHFMGQEAVATQSDMKRRIDDDTCSVDDQGKVDCGQATSEELPWNDKEELVSLHFSANTRAKTKASNSVFLLVPACVCLVVALWANKTDTKNAKQMAKPIAGFAFFFVCFALNLVDAQLLACLAAVGLLAVGYQSAQKKKIKAMILPQKEKCFV